MSNSDNSIDHNFFSSGSDDETKRKEIKPNYTDEGRKTPVAIHKRSGSGDGKHENITVHIPYSQEQQKEKDNTQPDDSSSSVTDVSPLSSPNPSPRRQNRKVRPKSSKSQSSKGSKKSQGYKNYYTSSSTDQSSSEETERENVSQKNKKLIKEKQKEVIRQRNDIASYNHRRRLLDVAAQNSMDLSQLLEVILTMNEGQESKVNPLNMRPQSGQVKKKNHSFTNDQVYEIDRENQRLLRELSRQNKRPSGRPSSAMSSRSSISTSSRSTFRPGSSVSGYRPSSSQARLYHAGRNRIKEQQRIEKENLALLKRLQSAKSDRNIQKRHLLNDYKRQTNYMTNPISRTPTGSIANRNYQRHLQKHGFSPSKPEWQE